MYDRTRTVRPNVRSIWPEQVRPNVRSSLPEVRFGHFDGKTPFFDKNMYAIFWMKIFYSFEIYCLAKKIFKKPLEKYYYRRLMYCRFHVKFGLIFRSNLLPFFAKVRPNCSAERSVKMAEPFGFGRTTFLAVRSYTSS